MTQEIGERPLLAKEVGDHDGDLVSREVGAVVVVVSGRLSRELPACFVVSGQLSAGENWPRAHARAGPCHAAPLRASRLSAT